MIAIDEDISKVGDMGLGGSDAEGPGLFPVQVRQNDHVEAAAAKEGQELGIPAVGVSNEGYGDRGSTDINSLEAEYGHVIHCDAADYGSQARGCLGGGGNRGG